MIFLGIPTGNRAERALKTVIQWKQFDFIRLAVYCWDSKTYEKLKGNVDKIFFGERKPFGVLHNYISNNIDDRWDLYICGADDLWPGENTDLLKKITSKYNGYVLGVSDGIQEILPTHPIITKKWFINNNKSIFDEQFFHNYVDADLLVRTYNANEFLHNDQILFDHRHPNKTKEKKDKIFKIGHKKRKIDKKYMLKKHPDFKSCNDIKPKTCHL